MAALAALEFFVIFPMDEFRYFKFRAVNKFLIDAIVNGTLYFAKPSRLNDPFDCQVDIRKSAKYAMPKVSGAKREILERIADVEGYLDVIQLRMTKIGVCSFSLTLEEPLLWSHYADEHRGISLMYQFTEDFLTDRSNKIIGVSDVKYGENPLSDWFIENIPDQIDDDFYDRFTTELLKRVLIIKGSGWDYEREARIIRERAGEFSIPNEFLKQVCFGLNTTDSDRRLIRKIIDSTGYTVDYCKIVRKESDFGIMAVEI